METIKILPHHAKFYFRTFFFGKDPDELNWYNDKKFQNSGINVINRVISNPSQPIQIARNYDSICQACPKNINGTNFMRPEEACMDYEKNSQRFHAVKYEELEYAVNFGILDYLDDNVPINSKTLFDALEPFYNDIFTGSTLSPYLQKISQHELWKGFFNMDDFKLAHLKKRDQHLLGKNPHMSLVESLFEQGVHF